MNRIHTPQRPVAPKRRPGKRPLSGAVILVGQHYAEAAGVTRASFRSDGAEAIIWRRTVGGVEEVLRAGGVALAHLDVNMPGGCAIDLTLRLRMGGFGDNPFLPVVVAASQPSESLVSSALWAGVDDIVAGRRAGAGLTNRIMRVAFNRRPFVATRRYVGPKHPRLEPDLGDAFEFEPPNALRAAIMGGSIDFLATEPAFERAQHRLTVMRLERLVLEIAAAARRTITLPASDSAALMAATRSLRDKAKEVPRFAEAVPPGHLRSAIERLSSVARIAAGQEAAARLTGEIAEAIAGILESRGEDVFEFPEDFMDTTVEAPGSKAPGAGA